MRKTAQLPPDHSQFSSAGPVSRCKGFGRRLLDGTTFRILQPVAAP